MVRVNYLSGDGDKHEIQAREGESLMQAAVRNDVPGIEGECGGELSCGTCHVHVDEAWFARLEPRDADEDDMLEMVEDLAVTSRLCCQVKATPELDGITVTVAT